MSAFEEQPRVGLFGTCGPTTFRQEIFIPEYEQLGIPYFNPQVEVEGWNPSLAEAEFDHLIYDTVQCWPVLGATYGTGSLSEEPFSIASSLRHDSPLPKFLIPMIEMTLADTLTDEVARKESMRARHIALKHLTEGKYPNVFVVSSLEEMLEVSITLHGVAARLVELAHMHSPAYRNFMEAHRAHAFVQAMRAGHLGDTALKLVNRHIP